MVLAALAAAAGLAWPILSQIAAMTGRPQWMPDITAGVAVVILAALAGQASSTRSFLVPAIAIAVVALAWHRAPALLVFLPPTAINLALGLFFATTLRPGREPRIARYARIERGGEPLPDDLARYARRLTFVWSVYFFLAAALGALLAAFAPLAVWSAFANVGSYALVALLFFGEYGYRLWRFSHYRHASLPDLFRRIARDRPLRSRLGE